MPPSYQQSPAPPAYQQPQMPPRQPPQGQPMPPQMPQMPPHPPSMGGLGPNLALGRPATQSSQYNHANAGPQGGVDGVKNGSFGFHTENEQSPWWQVDLGRVMPLREARLYNRMDCCAERSRSVHVLLSDDGRSWRGAFVNDGTVFGGVGSQPLVISLQGMAARFVRVTLRGRDHLQGTDDARREVAQ